MSTRTLVACASAVLLAAGCATTVSGTVAPPGRTTTAGTASNSATSPRGAGTASPIRTQLKSIVLRSSDLPAGWIGTPHVDDSDDVSSADQERILQCIHGARIVHAHQVAEVDSDDFSLGDAEITSSATRYRSQGDIAADTAAFRSPNTWRCMSREFTSEFAAELPPGTHRPKVSLTFARPPRHAPRNVVGAGIGTIRVTVNGAPLVGYVYVALVVGPSIEATVTVDSLGAPVPRSFVDSLAALVARRAGARQ